MNSDSPSRPAASVNPCFCGEFFCVAAFPSRPVSRPGRTLNADGAKQRRQRSFVGGGGKLMSGLMAGGRKQPEFWLVSYKARSPASVSARLLMGLMPPRGGFSPVWFGLEGGGISGLVGCRPRLLTVCLLTDCSAGGFCTSEPGGTLQFTGDALTNFAGNQRLHVSTEELDGSHCAHVHYLSPSFNGRMGWPPFLPEDHVKIQLG